MPLVPTRSWRAPVVAVAVVLTAVALPARAQVIPIPTPTLDFSGINVRGVISRNGTIVAEDEKGTLAGENAIVAPLYQPSDLERFPTSASALPGGYASALMATNGFGGVGVSFWSPGTPDFSAHTEWAQTANNSGPNGTIVQVDYTIPGLEASIFAGEGYGPFGPGAGPTVRAQAVLNVTRILADGTIESPQTIFDYELLIARRFRPNDISSYDVVRTSDLQADGGPERVVAQGDVRGIAYGPFSSTRLVGVLGAGETFTFQYRMEVETFARQSRTPELGYQGLVGDPFAIGGTGLVIHEVPNATTAAPEPATAALLALGLGGLAVARRRRGVSST